MDNLSHNYAQKLGVALLATVLMLGAFSITLFSLDQKEMEGEFGIVKGISTVNNYNLAMVNDGVAAGSSAGAIKSMVRTNLVETNGNSEVMGLPDLRPIKLLIRKAEQTDDNRLEAGDELTVRIAIKNIGHATTTESEYSLKWGVAGELTGSVPALESGKVFDTSHELTWATDSNELIRFAVKADSAEEINEAKEFNNVLIKKVRFHYRKCLASQDPTGENGTSTSAMVQERNCVDWLSDEGEEAEDESSEVNSDDIPEHLGDLAEEQKGQVLKLRERIRNLQRKITDLERKFIEREKVLTHKINKALTRRLKGKILLQVEGNGEAWYVDETTEERFYLKDGEAAYEALQAFGLGISNEDLESIPVGVEDRADRLDSDEDGLDDKLEEAIGTDPADPDSDDDGFTDGEEVKNMHDALGQRIKAYRKDLADRLEGKILLQVEGNGEAWYVHNGQRHYMKDGSLAYQIMRFLSLGITNDDIHQIPVGELE